MTEFKKNPTLTHAEDIVATYITNESSTVYVTSTIKENILDAIESNQISEHLFEHAQEEVLELLEDSFPRFVALNTKDLNL